MQELAVVEEFSPLPIPIIEEARVVLDLGPRWGLEGKVFGMGTSYVGHCTADVPACRGLCLTASAPEQFAASR